MFKHTISLSKNTMTTAGSAMFSSMVPVVDKKTKTFVDNNKLERLVRFGELLTKYAKIMDIPEYIVSEMDFEKMREDIVLYITSVNSLELIDLHVMIEDDFFRGKVLDYIVAIFDGPINRLIPMFIRVPKSLLTNYTGEELCEKVSIHTLKEFSNGCMGIIDHKIRKSRSEYFKNLFSNIEIIDAHARVVNFLGSKNRMRELFVIYRKSVWKSMSMEKKMISYTDY